MKIRKKTLIIIGATVICLIGLLNVVAAAVISSTVAKLEEQATSQNVDRLDGALSHELDNLNSTAQDYAGWDDTYAFVQNNNTGYIDSNLVDATLINLRLQVMLFVNSTGQIVFGKALNFTDMTEMPVPQSLMENVYAHDLLWHHKTAEDNIAGIVLLPESPMLVASQPILNSQGQGPIRGALIMGRFLDSAEIDYLNVTVNLPMTAQTLGAPWLSPDFQAANVSLAHGASFYDQAISTNTIAGYTMLKDIYGNPILIFRVDAPRLIFTQGQTTLIMFTALIMIVGFVFAVITVALLERFVLSRLSRVSKDIRDIGKKGDSAARVPVTGKDELSDLSNEINNMLSRLVQTEGELKEERDRAQTYLDIAGVMIVALDANGKITLMNRKGCDILECTIEEALGKNWFDTYLLPENKDQISKIFRTLMNDQPASGTPLEYNENLVLTRSGRERLIAWHNTVIRDSDRRIVGTLSSGIDVTDQKKAEKALCESELRFRRITETMLDVICQTDRAGIFQYVSPSTKRVLGYEPGDMLGKSIFDFVHPDDVDRVAEVIQRSVADRSWGRIEFRYKHAGGHYLWLDTVGNFLVDDEGKTVGAIFNSRDITKRKQLETKLQHTTKRLQTLLETATEGIITADPEENITFVNKAFAEIVGYGENELLNLNARKFLDEEGIRKLEEETQVRKTGVTSRYELTMYCKNGEPRIVQLSASPLWNEDGTYAGSLGIVTDITERRKVEETLRESQQKFERLFDSNPEAAAFVDANDHVLETNPRFTEVFGYSSEEAKGKALDDLIVPEDKKEETKTLTKESLSGYVFRETIRRTKNGLPVPVLISAAPITIGSQLTGYVVSYRDITERRNMEERLRESEERFRDIAERSFDAIAIVDSKGTITYASPSVGKVLGYLQTEVVGKSFLEYFSQAKLSDATQLFADLTQGKNLEGLKLELSKTDGTMATIEINASPIILKGEMTGIQAVFRDITQRKKMEEALRASEERFRGITERSFDIIATIDSNGLITYISPSVEKIIGYAAEEVTGKPFQDFFTTSNVSDVIKVFTEALQGKSSEGLVFGVIRKDGTQALVEVNVSPITKNGEIVGIQGVARDITERKKMEEALRESEEKLRHTIESSPDAIILTDLAGNVIDCNQATLDMYGFSTKEEAVGKAGFQFISAKDYEKAMESMKAILEKGSARNIEYTLLNKDGKEFLVDVSASVISDTSGEPKYIVAITRDITERKKMEEALRESEEKHRLLFENVNDVVFAYDREFTILSMSPSVEKTLGYKPEELVGRKFQELNLLAPESLETAVDNALHVLGGESISPSVYEFVKKDGTKGFGEITSSPLMREGKVVGVIAVARDITERKQMEERIRESEERLRQFIEFAPDAIYVNDCDGLFLDGNKQAEIMLGYKKEELIGKNMLEAGILPEEYAPKAVELVQKTMEGQKTGPDEMELIRKDGTRIWVEISSMPVKRGDSFEVLGIARDITNRKRIENALHESEEKIRNILQSSPDAIAVTDLNGTMIDCNQEALRLAGVSTKEEFLGKNTFDLISPRDYEKSMKNMEILLERGTIRDFEFTLVAKDGREFPAEVSMSLIRDLTGEPKYFVATIKNITERKEMLRKLEEYSQQLEEMVEKRTKQLKEAQEQLVKTERLAAIGQVAAMVGHDLRNPLTGIKGAAYYLKTKPALKTDKKTMEMLELIEKDVEYSNKIITDLLEYSRNVHLELTETTPRSIILETLFLLEVPKNVEIINLTQDEPRIKVDIEKLNRVFVNLIKNAFDAMPYDGKMTIKSTKTNDDVEFTFTDTGMGMTKEQMGKLWTPFFTTKAKGMGLGLPICKRIVEAHRGSIKVESMAGLGTTFTVTVPIELKQIEGGEKIWVRTPESLSLMTTKALDKS